MAIFTASKAGDENYVFTIDANSPAYPSKAAFDPNGDDWLYFWSDEAGFKPIIVNEFVDNGTEFEYYIYALNQNGFAQITAPIDYSSIPGAGFPFLKFADTSVVASAVGYYTIADEIFVGGDFYEAPATINGGIQNLSPVVIGSGTVSFGIHPTYDSFLIPGINLTGGGPFNSYILFAAGEAASGVWDYWGIIPDGLGGLEIKQIADNISTSFSINYYNYVGGEYWGLSYTGELLRWQFTDVGDPPIYSVDTLEFDDPFLNDCFQNGYLELHKMGPNWLGIVYEDINGPVPLQILKISGDWSSYSIGNISGGDPYTQSLIDGYLIGNSWPSFAYDEINDIILMTDGQEPPMYFATSSIGPSTISNLTTKIPTPVKLPCFVNCVPVIRR